jgi:hypothetical protein
MITYLAKFSSKLSDIVSPIRDLLKKDVESIWDCAQDEAFEKVKQAITQSPVLAYYDPKKPVKLQVDSSGLGIGVTCLQGSKLTAFASKTLTQAEIGYAQIEKQMLAILFGLNRFRQYCYARHTVLESDHKPIVYIMKKSLCNTTPRLQRMLFQLQQYDIEVIHVRGKNIPLADTLSRNFVSDTYPDLTEGLES